jgi:PPOX class probable F420-dependent enzyme
MPQATSASAASLSDAQRAFVLAHRVAHLATADAAGAPHVVPVTFALTPTSLYPGALYIGIDEKPKRPDQALKRLRNIAANPAVAVVVDRYDEDWQRLGWVMLRGPAATLRPADPEHAAAQALLLARYPQLRAMRIEALPVIALRIARVTAWGDLSVCAPPTR